MPINKPPHATSIMLVGDTPSHPAQPSRRYTITPNPARRNWSTKSFPPFKSRSKLGQEFRTYGSRKPLGRFFPSNEGLSQFTSTNINANNVNGTIHLYSILETGESCVMCSFTWKKRSGC
ncbi:uncharacterized protein LOC115966402 [Quercus lobata]|uniref:uncharacterized protein LOC115966402 n=1 Tax=Quercus lobata TaxID=97700 RepID=UPI0012477610|nr:uncharacterized protein LOC115966402 [Quercus lobata]